MQIVFNIAENSNVELVKGEYELLQGECCVTELKFNFPATIRGVAIGNYKKRIEFGECKELGECVKFIDDINGDTYELGDKCTAFKKVMVQLVLTYNDIKWKTMPVSLEFHESVNAEGNTVIQAQILSLAEIEAAWANDLQTTKAEWEAFITAHTLRIIHSAGDVPTADASSLGDTIFYLGANTDTAPLLVYGHYYKCNIVQGVYEWTDLTQDPNLAGAANGVREINKNQTLQFWKGTMDELANEAPQYNVAYIPEDENIEDVFNEVLENIVVPKATRAYGADEVKFEDVIRLVSDSETFNNVPNLEEGALYSVRYRITTDSGKNESATGLLIINGRGQIAQCSLAIANGAGLAYDYDNGAISITGGYSIVGARHELLFYKIGKLERLTAQIIMHTCEGGNAFNYFWTVILASENVRLAVGDTLLYMGEEATVTGIIEDGAKYEIKCLIDGLFENSIREFDVITVEVK